MFLGLGVVSTVRMPAGLDELRNGRSNESTSVHDLRGPYST